MHLSNESLLVIIFVGIVAGWLAGRSNRCIHWRLAAAATWCPLRHRDCCPNHQRLYRRGYTAADPSAGWRWLGLQTPLGPALALADTRAK
jgi:hypothetical protein